MYTINKPWFLLAVGFVGLAGVQLATAQTTTTITMGGDPGGVQGPVMGGVYTSPYYATVGTSANVPIICDDFVDNTYFSESWTAYVTSLASVPTTLTLPTTGPDYDASSGWSSSSTGGPLEWGGGFAAMSGAAPASTPLTQNQAYTVAAYLAAEIVETNQSAPGGAEKAGDLSYAMWALFDPAVFLENGSPCTLPSGEGCLSSPDLAAAESDLVTAYQMVTSQGLTAQNFVSNNKLNISSVTIYTYDSQPGVAPCTGATCPPQEFISVSMPEPSMASLLGVDLLGVAGLVLFAHRRRVGSERS